MFNLEQSIAEWRKQMLAAGIKLPVPLEELENHLRDEIELQIKLGTNEQQAFEIAAQQIGRAELLKTEFGNAGFLNWLGKDKQTKINRVFALLWLAYCSWVFFTFAVILSSPVFGVPFNFRPTLDWYLVFPIAAISLFGMIASIRLLVDNDREIRTLHFIAVLGLMVMVSHILSFRTARPLDIAMNFFNLASLWLLRSPSRKGPHTATR